MDALLEGPHKKQRTEAKRPKTAPVNASCWNCGGRGHTGDQCNAPTVEDLDRRFGQSIKQKARQIGRPDYVLLDSQFSCTSLPRHHRFSVS